MKYTIVVLYLHSETLEINADSWEEAEKKASEIATNQLTHVEDIPFKWEIADEWEAD